MSSPCIHKALSGVLANKGTKIFIPREQGNTCLKVRGSGNISYLLKGNIQNQILIFGV